MSFQEISRKSLWQAVCDAEPVVNKPRLTQPVSESERLRVKREEGEVIELSTPDRELLEEAGKREG